MLLLYGSISTKTNTFVYEEERSNLPMLPYLGLSVVRNGLNLRKGLYGNYIHEASIVDHNLISLIPTFFIGVKDASTFPYII